MRKLPDFTLHRVTSVEEACDARARFEERGTFYAGGTELLLAMKLGVMRYSELIDLKGVTELRQIKPGDDEESVDIGAAVTHRNVEESSLIRAEVPALARVERNVGNVRVRSSGTIGGNLAFAEPRSDTATVGLCLDASVEIASSSGRRWLPLEEFLVGSYETALGPDELLARLRVRSSATNRTVLYEKFQFHERPTVSVGLALETRDEEVVGGRVAVGSAVPVPTRCAGAEEELRGDLGGLSARADQVAEAALSDLEILDDVDGSAEYKQHLVRTLLRRLMARAAAPSS